jgi:hypothetical protein
MRRLHVNSGVMWIGLLWYFNFVQIPIQFAKAITGALVAWMSGYLVQD